MSLHGTFLTIIVKSIGVSFVTFVKQSGRCVFLDLYFQEVCRSKTIISTSLRSNLADSQLKGNVRINSIREIFLDVGSVEIRILDFVR